MNQKGMTMVEALMTVAIISLAVMVYTQFITVSKVEEKNMARGINMESLVVKVLEEERQEYKTKKMENRKEERERKVNYGGENYVIEVKAEKQNEKVVWKNENKDLIKITVKASVGKQEMEVDTYVTEGE